MAESKVIHLGRVYAVPQKPEDAPEPTELPDAMKLAGLVGFVSRDGDVLWAADCTCGWLSETCPNPDEPKYRFSVHLAEVNYGVPTEEQREAALAAVSMIRANVGEVGPSIGAVLRDAEKAAQWLASGKIDGVR